MLRKKLRWIGGDSLFTSVPTHVCIYLYCSNITRRMPTLSFCILLIIINEILGSGEDHCSLSKTNIQCVPCTILCDGLYRTCDEYFFCPRECNTHTNRQKCNEVCSKNCKSGKCKYREDTSRRLCSDGCEAGYAGEYCQDHCPEYCEECDQFNTTCTRCSLGYTGKICNEVLNTSRPFHPITNKCLKNCTVCNATSEECVTCTPSYYAINCEDKCADCTYNYYSTPESVNTTYSNTTNKSKEETVRPSNADSRDSLSIFPVLTGISFALLLAFTAGYIWHKVNAKYRLKCMCELRDTRLHSGGRSDGSHATYHGYAYIDEDNLDQDHSDLRPSRCGDSNQYESVGNSGTSGETDAESMSSISTLTGSIFRNLFEMRNEIDDNNEINPNQQGDVDSVCGEEYNETRYLTPTTGSCAKNS